MSDDNSPQLRTKGLLEKNLYKLTNRFEELEDRVELLDAFFTQLNGDHGGNSHKIKEFEKRVTQFETDLESVPEIFEGKIATLQVQNFELRDHLNATIDTLNNIVKILNDQVIDEEPIVEGNPDGELLYPEQDMVEDTQPTLSQVYAMYQSQPPDEEGWDEMTAAIKAAEEYEASRKAKQNE